MAGGLHEDIIAPPVRVFTDGYYQFSSKGHSRPHYFHSPAQIKSPASHPPPLLPSRTSSKPCATPRPHRSVGGPGMQAVFLDSGHKSCGTGVFLPRGAGGAGPKPAKKPAFAPVLLPSRVVQALNLNVHVLGLQIKPRDCKNNSLKVEASDRGINRKTKGSDVMPMQSCVTSQNRTSSADIFLPKEWTY